MPQTVICPNCREELEIPSELLQSEVRCEVCKNVFIPARDGMDSSPVSARSRSRDRDGYDNGSRRSRPRKGGTGCLWLILLGTFGIGALGCGGVCIWAVMFTFPSFEPFDAKEGRFHAEFPKFPTAFDDIDPDKRNRKNFESKRPFPPEVFFVRYIDLNKDTNVQGKNGMMILNEEVDQFVANQPGTKEIKRSHGTVGGYDSVDLLMRHPGDPDAQTAARIILAGHRVYFVGVSGGNNIQFDTPYVAHFLDAFRIVDTPADQQK